MEVSRTLREKYELKKRSPRGQAKVFCSKCGNPLEHSRHKKQRYCKPCHASYMKSFRLKAKTQTLKKVA